MIDLNDTLFALSIYCLYSVHYLWNISILTSILLIDMLSNNYKLVLHWTCFWPSPLRSLAIPYFFLNPPLFYKYRRKDESTTTICYMLASLNVGSYLRCGILAKKEPDSTQGWINYYYWIHASIPQRRQLSAMWHLSQKRARRHARMNQLLLLNTC